LNVHRGKGNRDYRGTAGCADEELQKIRTIQDAINFIKKKKGLAS